MRVKPQTVVTDSAVNPSHHTGLRTAPWSGSFRHSQNWNQSMSGVLKQLELTHLRAHMDALSFATDHRDSSKSAFEDQRSASSSNCCCKYCAIVKLKHTHTHTQWLVCLNCTYMSWGFLGVTPVSHLQDSDRGRLLILHRVVVSVTWLYCIFLCVFRYNLHFDWGLFSVYLIKGFGKFFSVSFVLNFSIFFYWIYFCFLLVLPVHSDKNVCLHCVCLSVLAVWPLTPLWDWALP